MRLDYNNIHEWAAQQGWEDDADIADILHDHAYQCIECKDHFTELSDLTDWVCEECDVDYRLQGGDVDQRKEHGTW